MGISSHSCLLCDPDKDTNEMKTCLRHISGRHVGGMVDARQLEVQALSRLTLTPCEVERQAVLSQSRHPTVGILHAEI